jgi:phospholipid/cholesterol/gamma-HCH transport system substrate-binding protein
VAKNANRAVARVDALIARVEAGPGTLHGLIFDDKGTEMLGELERASREIAEVVSDVRHGQGLVHDLVYEKEYADMLRNFTALSQTLKQVGDEVKAGHGTVGALLRDPTVYEDLKIILGNVKRNQLMKALLRWAIKRDGLSGESQLAPGRAEK